MIRITMTTICGTDVHIVKGEYPVPAGRTLGHEPIGVISEIGLGVTGYKVGERVLVGAITPCGVCCECLDGKQSQCGGKPMGGWRFGNTIDGSHAEYLLVPHAMANLTPIPDDLTDEQVLMCPDVMSTGFGAAEAGKVKIGDSVAVFAQGPIGMCATVGARLLGATKILGVDSNPKRIKMAQMLGADAMVNFKEGDPVALIMEATGGRGVDVAIGQSNPFSTLSERPINIFSPIDLSDTPSAYQFHPYPSNSPLINIPTPRPPPTRPSLPPPVHSPKQRRWERSKRSRAACGSSNPAGWLLAWGSTPKTCPSRWMWTRGARASWTSRSAARFAPGGRSACAV